jgi:hypothetical protein
MLFMLDALRLALFGMLDPVLLAGADLAIAGFSYKCLPLIQFFSFQTRR